MNELTQFLKSAAATGLTVGMYNASAHAYVSEHNWEEIQLGMDASGSRSAFQGPFPQYGPGAVIPDSEVWMVTSPSKDIVSNFGMGLTVYASDDTGPLHVPGQTLEQTLEDLVKLPFAQKIYMRPNWRDV